MHSDPGLLLNTSLLFLVGQGKDPSDLSRYDLSQNGLSFPKFLKKIASVHLLKV